MDKVLVTGIGGFIGSHVFDELQRRNIEVGHTEEQSDVSILLGRSDRWIDNIGFIRDRLKLSGGKIIYVSSSVVHSKIPSMYRAEKLFCEEMCRIVGKTIVRPYNVYGPGQPDNFVIPTIINQALKGDTIVLKDKFAERNFIYVKDTAKALVDIALSNNLLADTIELGHERRLIWRIVEIVGNILGKKLTIDAPAANEVEGDSVYMPLDSNKWPTDGFISMKKGLKETIEHYKKGCA